MAFSTDSLSNVLLRLARQVMALALLIWGLAFLESTDPFRLVAIGLGIAIGAVFVICEILDSRKYISVHADTFIIQTPFLGLPGYLMLTGVSVGVLLLLAMIPENASEATKLMHLAASACVGFLVPPVTVFLYKVRRTTVEIEGYRHDGIEPYYPGIYWVFHFFSEVIVYAVAGMIIVEYAAIIPAVMLIVVYRAMTVFSLETLRSRLSIKHRLIALLVVCALVGLGLFVKPELIRLLHASLVDIEILTSLPQFRLIELSLLWMLLGTVANLLLGGTFYSSTLETEGHWLYNLAVPLFWTLISVIGLGEAVVGGYGLLTVWGIAILWAPTFPYPFFFGPAIRMTTQRDGTSALLAVWNFFSLLFILVAYANYGMMVGIILGIACFGITTLAGLKMSIFGQAS